MKENVLVDLSKRFAVNIVIVCENISKRRKEYVLFKQLLKSGTSIGANIYEANYAASKADFINKLQIALKECYESQYWLDIFKETEIVSKEEYTELYSQCSRIRRMLISSINTSKNNN